MVGASFPSLPAAPSFPFVPSLPFKSGKVTVMVLPSERVKIKELLEYSTFVKFAASFPFVPSLPFFGGLKLVTKLVPSLKVKIISVWSALNLAPVIFAASFPSLPAAPSFPFVPSLPFKSGKVTVMVLPSERVKIKELLEYSTFVKFAASFPAGPTCPGSPFSPLIPLKL